MKCQSVCLREELEAHASGIVCLTGGGGKTTLLHALGESLAAAGRTVLCTTTTRMRRPAATKLLPVSLIADPGGLILPPSGALLAAREAPQSGDAGKVYGYAPAEIDGLAQRRFASWILVEADGANGRPIKAPAEHEPVIPSMTSFVIAVIGLGGINKPFGPETVFRMERVAALTGLRPGAPLTVEAATAIVTHPFGLFKGCPPGARRLLFCNQVDMPGAAAAGTDLAEILAMRHSGFLHGLYIGSLLREGLQCQSLPTA